MTNETIIGILIEEKRLLLLWLEELLNSIPSCNYIQAYVDKKGHVTDAVSDIIFAREELKLQIQAIDEILEEL